MADIESSSPAKPETRDFTLDTDGDGLDLDDIVGRLDAFQLLRHDDGPESDQVLHDLGATSEVDRQPGMLSWSGEAKFSRQFAQHPITGVPPLEPGFGDRSQDPWAIRGAESLDQILSEGVDITGAH